MKLFARIYKDAFQGGNGPYVFPPEYAEAVRLSYGANPIGVVVRNYFAHDENGEIVGILSLISEGHIFGIYNVAALPFCQGRGIGSFLTMKGVYDAFKSGAKTVFLQTEPDSVNENFYYNRGFHTRFIATCYVKSNTPP